MTAPALSVLLTTCNRADMLRNSLEAIRAQSRLDESVEIIVSDDRSEDATPEILSEYLRILPGMSCYRQDTRLGVQANSAFLLGQARGKFVLFTGDDDALPPECVSRLVERIKDDAELDLLFTDVEVCDRSMQPLARISAYPGAGYVDPAACLRDFLVSDAMATIVCRRDHLVQGGLWMPAEPQCDRMAFYRILLRARRVFYIPEPLYRFRITPGSFGSFSVEKQEALAASYRRMLDMLSRECPTAMPELAPHIGAMYAWHAKSMMAAYEVEFAHGRINGGQTRRAMEALLGVFPEGRLTTMSAKLWLSSYIGLWWLRAVRRILGKPDRYHGLADIFGKHATASR